MTTLLCGLLRCGLLQTCRMYVSGINIPLRRKHQSHELTIDVQERATGHLVYHSLHNTQPAARRAGLQALQHHDHHENPVLATKALLAALFQPRVRRTPADLRGLKAYFQKRMAGNNINNNNNRLADYRLASIGLNRITLVEKATQNYPVPGASSPLFTPLHWSRSYGGMLFLTHSPLSTSYLERFPF